MAFMLTFNGDGDVCPGLGWNSDAMTLALEMTSHFMQCSKILLYDIGSQEGVWTGENAKWF